MGPMLPVWLQRPYLFPQPVDVEPVVPARGGQVSGDDALTYPPGQGPGRDPQLAGRLPRRDKIHGHQARRTEGLAVRSWPV